MPTSLKAAKAANATVKLPFRPVAVFIGGTSGIGQGAAEAFARYTNGDAHIIISGRNEAAAKKIIEGFPKSPLSKYQFLPCDASKLANVTAASMTLKENFGVDKINYLFMSPGFFTVTGSFDDNGEGLDKKFAIHYYSRFKFFTELAPLLLAAKEAEEEARVITVLGAGHGGELDRNDLGLFENYSVMKCGQQSPTYSSLTVEALAKKYPNLAFIHIYPGAVNTNIFKSSNLVLRAIAALASPLLTSVTDCSEWMVRTIFDPGYARGAFHLDEHADPVPRAKLGNLSEENQKIVYDHFMEIASKC